MEPETRNLVIILGPTGVGKSRTAVDLALKFGGEIINGDSIQVYRGFDIGTDKPDLEARKDVPHHLIDAVEPGIQLLKNHPMYVSRRLSQNVIRMPWTARRSCHRTAPMGD